MLENVQQPTVILWADKDSIFPIEIAEKINKKIKNSRLETVK
jgi:pimeloyl-ACP methyl ester carboxylesterase